jgi:hypothetical protein
MLVKVDWVEGWSQFGRVGSRGSEAVHKRRIFWWWGTHAELVEDLKKTLETTIDSHDFADSRGGGSEIGEMTKGVE